MWPLERRRGVLRIGRERVERWGPQGQGLECLDRRRLDAPEPVALEAAVTALCAGVTVPIDLVLESAWLPVLLLPCGRRLWSRRQVEALLRHRLELLYGDAAEPVAQWSLQLDHRPGDAHGLGYGLAPSVRDALMRASAATGCRWASLQPAWAWGLQHVGARDGWWVWVEQDRTLLGHLVRRRVVMLDAALPVDVRDWAGVVAIEALRSGLANGPLTVGGWHDAEHRDVATPWRGVVGEAPAVAEVAT